MNADISPDLTRKLDWLGLACDITGTAIRMSYVGGLTADVHGVTGVAAILLMIIHAIWATFESDEIGILLTPEQAEHLAAALLEAARQSRATPWV